DVDLGLEIGEGATVAEVDEADAPIIRMVSMLIIEAHRAGASDIHLEPLDKKFRVRFRIDGKLQEMPAPPKRLQSAIVSRLKVMTGSMSIAEKRLPQDGRIQVKIKKEADRPPCFHDSYQSRRKFGHSNSRQSEPDAGASRAWLLQRRPGKIRAFDSTSRWNSARDRPDRLRKNEHALRLPQLHQQTRPQDHHCRGADRIPNDRHQPGPGKLGNRNDVPGRV